MTKVSTNRPVGLEAHGITNLGVVKWLFSR